MPLIMIRRESSETVNALPVTVTIIIIANNDFQVVQFHGQFSVLVLLTSSI
jgi:hypothetical protein